MNGGESAASGVLRLPEFSGGTEADRTGVCGCAGETLARLAGTAFGPFSSFSRLCTASVVQVGPPAACTENNDSVVDSAAATMLFAHVLSRVARRVVAVRCSSTPDRTGVRVPVFRTTNRLLLLFSLVSHQCLRPDSNVVVRPSEKLARLRSKNAPRYAARSGLGQRSRPPGESVIWSIVSSDFATDRICPWSAVASARPWARAPAAAPATTAP